MATIKLNGDKVYCSDCKYLYHAEYSWLCVYKDNIIWTDHPVHKRQWDVVREGLARNTNCDCKDYKRKWWKFWR